ncbi:hypothetical protein ABPG75_005680 [Micractinium tetrahymenae]
MSWLRAFAPATALALLLVAVVADARQLQQSYGPVAQEVVSMCPAYSFYGEDFIVGLNLINITSATSAGACCKLCSDLSSCTRYSWCSSNQTEGCPTPLGPVANATFPAGTCLLSRTTAPDGNNYITYSRQQSGVLWVGGVYTAGNITVSESAAVSSDFAEYIGSANDTFLCRLVATGATQAALSPLNSTDATGPAVTPGQKLNYTGVQVADGSNRRYAAVLTNADQSVAWLFPVNQLAYCPDATPGCTANADGGRNEVGASCESDSECCGGPVCLPRGVTDIVVNWEDASGAAKGSQFKVGPDWSTLPNECVPPPKNSSDPAVIVRSTWWRGPSYVNCQTFSLFAYLAGRNPWSTNASSEWTAPPANIVVDSSAVEAYRQQLCSDTDTAGASLAASLAAGGEEGGPYNCSADKQLAQLFVDYANPTDATLDALVGNAENFAAAAASSGEAACVSVAVLDAAATRVLETRDVHTPAGGSPKLSPSPAPSPSPSPPLPSNAGLLPNGTLRLSGSDSCTRGTAEVVMAGSWGAVCSAAEGGDAGHQWNAQVICRGQGLPSEQPTVSAATAPAGTAVWIKELNCTGSERSIMECPHTMADGSSAGSEDCLALSVTCADAASADSAAAAMCSQRPGRCQTLPGSCDPAQGYCSFKAQPAGTPCLGGVCNERGECAASN